MVVTTRNRFRYLFRLALPYAFRKSNVLVKPNVLEDVKQIAKLEECAEEILEVDRNTAMLAKEALVQLQAYFPVGTEYSLRGSFETAGALVLEIWSTDSFEKSIKTLERFEDDWWLDHVRDGLIIGMHCV